jgi:hypothetical protein
MFCLLEEKERSSDTPSSSFAVKAAKHDWGMELVLWECFGEHTE